MRSSTPILLSTLLAVLLSFAVQAQQINVGAMEPDSDANYPSEFYMASMEVTHQMLVRTCRVVRSVRHPDPERPEGLLVSVTPDLEVYDIQALAEGKTEVLQTVSYALIFPRQHGGKLSLQPGRSVAINFFFVPSETAEELAAGYELKKEDTISYLKFAGSSVSDIHATKDEAEKAIGFSR